MAEPAIPERRKIIDFLRTLAVPSAVEDGLLRAGHGGVVECSRSASSVQGVVKDEREQSHSVRLEVLSLRSVTAECSCGACTSPTIEHGSHLINGWCAHAVALLWRAYELGFFSADGGFAPRDATHRATVASAADVAQAIRDLSNSSLHQVEEALIEPRVRILLELSGDRMGVQITFDDVVQEPALFEHGLRRSARALDNILLESVDELGLWDEIHRCWFVNSSEGIERVLGLLDEFSDVCSYETGQPVRRARDPVGAKLTIRWESTGAELAMDWVLADGTVVARSHDLLGNGPYWTVIGEEVYRLSSEAAVVAALFPLGPRFSLTRGQIAPLLEVIRESLHRRDLVVVQNEQLQPNSEVHAPSVTLYLERRDDSPEHFANSNAIEIAASLEFDYPVPPSGENLVYLPDRQRERDCHDRLLALGFIYQRDRRRYQIQGDAALDLLARARDELKGWKIVGLDQIQRTVRIVDASVAITLASSADDTVTRSDKAAKLARIDWFDCHVSLVLNNANVPLSTLFKSDVKSASSDDARWIRLDSGAFTRVPGGTVGQLKSMLGMLDPNFRLSNSIKTRLKAATALGLARIQDKHFAVTLDKPLRSLADKLEDFSGIEAVKLSKAFDGSLRPYQAEGVNWLNFLWQFNLGGVLADEMGLGKTVQTLAWLQTLKDRCTKRGAKRPPEAWKPALVVTPTSVLMNWWYEAKRFTPKLRTLVLHGTKRKQLFANLSEYDVVITSYALLRVDRYELERFEFGYLILDEAQHIKNYQAATTVAAKSIRSRHRLALTGTPTENRPLELWSIMDFLMAGYLGTPDFFRTHIERPILEHGGGTDVARFLRDRTRPFILRRTKSEVEKDLPPKIESVLPVEMTPSQRELYGRILEEVRPRVLDAVAKKGVAGASVSILAALLRLRQVCNHPNSIDALKDVPGYDSGKFSALKELLEEALETGRKILLFAQFREMLALIRKHLDEQQIKYQYLDGTTRNRQAVIDEFSSDPETRVFLISLKAGGQGLNLTAADMVILYDPWWNPAVESQAIDRAHRIGQKKTVYVYRLVTEESVEQKIMDLKRRKAAIVNALVNEQGVSTLALTKGDLEQLFSPLKPAD